MINLFLTTLIIFLQQIVRRFISLYINLNKYIYINIHIIKHNILYIVIKILIYREFNVVRNNDMIPDYIKYTVFLFFWTCEYPK